MIDEINCNELVELVTDYLDGALTAEERARFEAHLEVCRGCRTYLEQIRQTIRLTGRLTEDSLDPAAREQLLLTFRGWKQR
jgi:anti-sigma factor RsiW